MTETIDLRTDALTRPTEAMWEAMRNAEFGWSESENGSLRALEELGAELFGKEAAMFVPTCSVANLLAAMVLGERGTQVICEQSAHMVTLEEWNLAYVCGLFPMLLMGHYGVLDHEEIDDVIRRAKRFNLPRTSLVCLENTHNNAGGTIVTVAQTAAIVESARRHGASVHLDGARLLNAAVAQDTSGAALAEGVDTVSFSLNKGLSAPWGALLCGSHSVIAMARQRAKYLGIASIHKQSLFAAAGIVALTSMTDELAEDNRRAALLAESLQSMSGLKIDLRTVQSNIVLVDTQASGRTAPDVVQRLQRESVLSKARSGDYEVRLVTHRHITDEHIPLVCQAMAWALGPEENGEAASENGVRA